MCYSKFSSSDGKGGAGDLGDCGYYDTSDPPTNCTTATPLWGSTEAICSGESCVSLSSGAERCERPQRHMFSSRNNSGKRIISCLFPVARLKSANGKALFLVSVAIIPYIPRQSCFQREQGFAMPHKNVLPDVALPGAGNCDETTFRCNCTEGYAGGACELMVNGNIKQRRRTERECIVH